MKIELATLAAPAVTALLVHEVQPNNIDGGDPLAMAATKRLPAMVALVDAARAADIPVIHCLKIFRRDARARNRNTPLYRRRGVLPTGPVEPDSAPVDGCVVHPAFGHDERDLVMTRLHGMSGVTDTGVVPVLRTLGATSVVVIGISLNVGVTNASMDLMNQGFEVIVPRDLVVGVPEEYGEQVIDNTLKVIATVTTSQALRDVWREAGQSNS